MRASIKYLQYTVYCLRAHLNFITTHEGGNIITIVQMGRGRLREFIQNFPSTKQKS